LPLPRSEANHIHGKEEHPMHLDETQSLRNSPADRERGRLDRRRLLRYASVGLAAPTALALAGLPGRAAHAQTPEATPGGDALPAAAQGPAIPPAGYLVQEVGGGLYAVTDGAYQAMFLVSSEGVIAVDAPPTIGANLLRAISAVTQQPVTHVVYSHSHADHIGAAVLFPADAERIAHTETKRLLEATGDPNRPLPTRTFDDRYTLQVGDQTLELAFKGSNHSPDNIFAWAPRQETLLLIDVVFPGWVPFKNLAVSQNIPGWLAAHDQALAYPFKTLVSGHLGRLGTRADVEVQQAYLADLRAAAEAALGGVDFGAIVQRVGVTDTWALFDAYFDAVAAMATEATLAGWGDRLGGFAAFTPDNAFAMAESLRIDYGHLGPFGIRQ
jgi:glyoxylase-like metal-dependent hydrolase (beta-lactamase superfamily II)